MIEEGDNIIALMPKSRKLTHGRIYKLEWISSTGLYYAVRNNDGKIKPYVKSNFVKSW